MSSKCGAEGRNEEGEEKQKEEKGKFTNLEVCITK